MSNVTGEIKAAILASAAYERGEEISATTVRTMMRQRHSLKDCGNALSKLAQTPELERVRLGFYKRPTNARWLRMPWRRRSNEQVGLDDLSPFALQHGLSREETQLAENFNLTSDEFYHRYGMRPRT